jgi:hypothetical protein
MHVNRRYLPAFSCRKNRTAPPQLHLAVEAAYNPIKLRMQLWQLFLTVLIADRRVILSGYIFSSLSLSLSHFFFAFTYFYSRTSSDFHFLADFFAADDLTDKVKAETVALPGGK